jgi:hypothetical protein
MMSQVAENAAITLLTSREQKALDYYKETHSKELVSIKYGIDFFKLFESQKAKDYLAYTSRSKDDMDKDFVQHSLSDSSVVVIDTLKKLKKIIDICVPDDATRIYDIDVRNGLMAIAERNKMMGLYAPERGIKVNVDVDTEKIIGKYKDLLEKYKKEY